MNRTQVILKVPKFFVTPVKNSVAYFLVEAVERKEIFESYTKCSILLTSILQVDLQRFVSASSQEATRGPFIGKN